MADVKAYRTFYFNPKNDVPVTAPGWIVVCGRTANEAVARLPAAVQKKLMAYKTRCEKEDQDTYEDYEDLMGGTCMEGASFSFFNDADWDSTLFADALDDACDGVDYAGGPFEGEGECDGKSGTCMCDHSEDLKDE